MKPSFQTKLTTTKALPCAIAVRFIALPLDTGRLEAFSGTPMKKREPKMLVDFLTPKTSRSATGTKVTVPCM